MGAIEAVMQLPPAPVMLLAVGEKEQNVTTIGMFNVFSVDPTIVGIGIRSSRYSYKLLEETDDFSLTCRERIYWTTSFAAGTIPAAG